jgi:hypothetical protein
MDEHMERSKAGLAELSNPPNPLKTKYVKTAVYVQKIGEVGN